MYPILHVGALCGLDLQKFSQEHLVPLEEDICFCWKHLVPSMNFHCHSCIKLISHSWDLWDALVSPIVLVLLLPSYCNWCNTTLILVVSTPTPVSPVYFPDCFISFKTWTSTLEVQRSNRLLTIRGVIFGCLWDSASLNSCMTRCAWIVCHIY